MKNDDLVRIGAAVRQRPCATTRAASSTSIMNGEPKDKGKHYKKRKKTIIRYKTVGVSSNLVCSLS